MICIATVLTQHTTVYIKPHNAVESHEGENSLTASHYVSRNWSSHNDDAFTLHPPEIIFSDHDQKRRWHMLELSSGGNESHCQHSRILAFLCGIKFDLYLPGFAIPVVMLVWHVPRLVVEYYKRLHCVPWPMLCWEWKNHRSLVPKSTTSSCDDDEDEDDDNNNNMLIDCVVIGLIINHTSILLKNYIILDFNNKNTLTMPFENPMVIFKLFGYRRPCGWVFCCNMSAGEMVYLEQCPTMTVYFSK